MNDAIIRLEEVSYRYPDGTSALNNCTLGIHRNRRTAVLGANGAGKTTMFLHLNGIVQPTSGRLFWGNTPLDYSRAGLRKLRSKVGMVFQNPDSQLFSASVREDISFGPMNLGLDISTVRQRVDKALQAVAMAELADKPVHNLSYGQKKRVCIAGVLAMEPEIIVLDEPMAGLDAAMQLELTAVLEKLHGGGITIVIATHDLDFAYGWADQTLVMESGRVLAHGTPDDILLRPEVGETLGATPQVAEIIHSLSLIGIDLRGNGYLPRTKDELVKAITAFAGREDTP